MEAKLRREALRRAAARRRLLIRGAWIGFLVIAVGAVASVVVNQSSKEANARALEQRLLARSAGAAKAAGCISVRTVPAYVGDDQEHVGSLPALSSYPSTPPASGPHLITPLGHGVYRDPPNLGEAVHSMEHGAAIVWLRPGVTGRQVMELQDTLPADPYVIVAPYAYDGPGGSLPGGKQMVLVAWHRLQLCDDVSAPAAVAFTHAYAFDPGDPSVYRGEAPERGAPI